MKISMILSLTMCFVFATTNIEATRPSDVKYYQDRNDEELGDVSRVSIKVFRGADREENGKQYAPWGFWIKQPSGH